MQEIEWMDRVRSTYAALRPSEQKVADFVLANPERCAKASIGELAEWVQVSQPTVIRFVQALGFDGYRHFKYCLARSQGAQGPAGHFGTPGGL